MSAYTELDIREKTQRKFIESQVERDFNSKFVEGVLAKYQGINFQGFLRSGKCR